MTTLQLSLLVFNLKNKIQLLSPIRYCYVFLDTVLPTFPSLLKVDFMMNILQVAMEFLKKAILSSSLYLELTDFPYLQLFLHAKFS